MGYVGAPPQPGWQQYLKMKIWPGGLSCWEHLVFRGLDLILLSHPPSHSPHKKYLPLILMSLSFNPSLMNSTLRNPASSSAPATSSVSEKRSRGEDEGSAPPVSPDDGAKRPKDDTQTMDAVTTPAAAQPPTPLAPVTKRLTGLFGKMKETAAAANKSKSASFAETAKQAPIFAKQRKLPAFSPTHVIYIWTTAIASASSPPAKAMAACVKTVFASIQAAGKQKRGRVGLFPRASKAKAIESSALLPSSWVTLKSYVMLQCDEDTLLVSLKGAKTREIPFVIMIGSTVPLREDIVSLAVDLVDSGVRVEPKRMPCWMSKQDILVAMIPKKTNLSYVQVQLQRTLEESLLEWSSAADCQTPVDVSPVVMANVRHGGKVKIQVTCAYPPNAYDNRKRGERPRFDSRNKMVMTVEYDAEYELVLKDQELRKIWKLKMRDVLGIKAFVFIVADEDLDSVHAFKRYKEIISRNHAANESMTGIELPGVTELDSPMTMQVTDGGAPVALSLRMVLMALEYKPGKPLFHLLAWGAGHTCEGFYPEHADRERLASQHTAGMVMFELGERYGIAIDDILTFLHQCFDKTSYHQATSLAFRDDNGLVAIQQDVSHFDDDELEELRSQEWIDMSVLDADGPAPAIDHGSGLIYDLDEATDFGSVATNLTEDGSSTGHAVRGLAALRLATEMAAAAAQDMDLDNNGQETNSPGTTSNAGSKTTASDGDEDSDVAGTNETYPMGAGPRPPPSPDAARTDAGASSTAGGSPSAGDSDGRSPPEGSGEA